MPPRGSNFQTGRSGRGRLEGEVPGPFEITRVGADLGRAELDLDAMRTAAVGRDVPGELVPKLSQLRLAAARFDLEPAHREPAKRRYLEDHAAGGSPGERGDFEIVDEIHAAHESAPHILEVD